MKFSHFTQFSLRTLFVLMTVCCMVMGIWTVYVHPYRQQTQAVALIEKYQGSVTSKEAEGSAWQRWLVVKLLGQDQYICITVADLRKTKPTPETLQSLGNLCFLEELYLDHTGMEDSYFASLSRLRQLKILSLRYTAVTDHGLESLSRLNPFEELYLTGTQISDPSIPRLTQLTNLRQLYVRWTGITPSGVERLQEALPRCAVHHHELSAVQ